MSEATVGIAWMNICMDMISMKIFAATIDRDLSHTACFTEITSASQRPIKIVLLPAVFFKFLQFLNNIQICFTQFRFVTVAFQHEVCQPFQRIIGFNFDKVVKRIWQRLVKNGAKIFIEMSEIKMLIENHFVRISLHYKMISKHNEFVAYCLERRRAIHVWHRLRYGFRVQHSSHHR